MQTSTEKGYTTQRRWAESPNVSMLMSSTCLIAVRMSFGTDLYRHHHEAAVLDTPFGNHLLGKSAHRASLSLEDRDLHAGIVVEVHVQR